MNRDTRRTPAGSKHAKKKTPDRKTDRQTDGRTDRHIDKQMEESSMDSGTVIQTDKTDRLTGNRGVLLTCVPTCTYMYVTGCVCLCVCRQIDLPTTQACR